jgi:hypothetical protein
VCSFFLHTLNLSYIPLIFFLTLYLVSETYPYKYCCMNHSHRRIICPPCGAEHSGGGEAARQDSPKKFFRKLLTGLTYVPRVILTDKLKSHGAAKREILPAVEHRQHRYINTRTENSHQPTHQRE